MGIDLDYLRLYASTYITKPIMTYYRCQTCNTWYTSACPVCTSIVEIAPSPNPPCEVV